MSRSYDVAIIGYGPVGAILANLLGRAGHSVLVVDRAADIYDKPRAINIDHEVMRVLQSIGLADEILEGTVQHPGTDFLGVDGATIKQFEPPASPYLLYWPPNLMFVQPEFEPVIRRGAAALPSVEVRLSTECTGVADTGNEVRLTLKGSQGTEQVEAKYAVACDGATSSVRKWLEVRHESLEFDEYWTVVDAWLVRETALPRRTTQYCWPEGPATYVVGPRNLRRWEVKLLPGETVGDFDDLGYLRGRLSAYVDPGALELWRVATYRFHALVAEAWRQGRIFLAGDAAHQMPPFMAQGLCSGVRDVANLGWKLSGVLAGTYAPALLDTYELERKPHIRALTETTKAIGEIIGELDPDAAARRDEALLAQIERGEAVSLRQALIPRLTTGIVGKTSSGETALGAGELFPQPRVVGATGSGRLLDDLVGDRFLILTRAGVPLPGTFSELPAGAATHFQLTDKYDDTKDSNEVEDLDGTLSSWMARSEMSAVIVRPDRYVFGAARSSEELKALLEQLLTDVPFISGRPAK